MIFSLKDKISPAITLIETLEIKFPGGGNGNAPQYSCMESPMDRGAWQATVHGITKVGHDLVTKPPPAVLKNF